MVHAKPLLIKHREKTIVKKILVLMCALFLTQAALAGKGQVIPGGTSASTVTVFVPGGGPTTGGGGGGGGGGGASNVPAGSPLQVAISGGPLVVSGGTPATNAQIIAAMEAAGIPTDNVTFE